MSKPAPFVIVKNQSMPDVATNGVVRLMCLDEGGRVVLRRGVSGLMASPVAEKLIPLLNQLAGELIENAEMPAGDVQARLHALQLACQPKEPQAIEWAFAELDGVRVYTDGTDMIMTRRDLTVS